MTPLTKILRTLLAVDRRVGCIDRRRVWSKSSTLDAFCRQHSRLTMAKFSLTPRCAPTFGKPESVCNTVWLRREKAYMPKIQFDSFSSFDAIAACDGQKARRTDRRTLDDSIYRASIASSGKNTAVLQLFAKWYRFPVAWTTSKRKCVNYRCDRK